MIKLIKFIFYIGLLLFAFISGVKYSTQTKQIANWLFETKEQEVDFDKTKGTSKILEQEPIIEELEEEIPSEILLEDELIEEENLDSNPNDTTKNE